MKTMNRAGFAAIVIAAAVMAQSAAVMAADFTDGGLAVAEEPMFVEEAVVVEEASAAEAVVVVEDMEEVPVVEETVEAEKTAVVEEAPVVEEAAAVEEAPVVEEAAAVEETAESYRTAFQFENDEVIIVAEAAQEAQLPMNTEMAAVRLAEGSAEYEAAKAASAAAVGADEEAQYMFYSISFVADGQEIEPADGTVSVQIQFKNIQADETAEQNVLHIGDAGVQNVTAPAAAGSSMSSVRFAF